VEADAAKKAQHDANLPEAGILTELLSILFPVRCVHCGASGNWLCHACAASLAPVGPHCCRRCGRAADSDLDECPECRTRELHFHGARSAFCYEGPARSLIHRLKYSGQRRLAGFMAEISAPLLADWLSQTNAGGASRNDAGLTGGDERVTLTCVPLHSSKLVSRGYNQASMYARALSRRLGLPLSDLLSRHHPTTPQNTLDFRQRRNNLSGSILLSRKTPRLTGRVILVDDVYTTGATAAECARILNEGLGVQVYIWTFGRTVRRQPIISGGWRPAARKPKGYVQGANHA